MSNIVELNAPCRDIGESQEIRLDYLFKAVVYYAVIENDEIKAKSLLNAALIAGLPEWVPVTDEQDKWYEGIDFGAYFRRFPMF